jgi:hypothetical protein
MRAQDFFDFIGTVKDKNPFHIGSPFQLDFESGSPDSVPAPLVPWDKQLPACWDSALRCSCGDCPADPTCSRAPIVPAAPAGCIVGSVVGVTFYCGALAALVLPCALLAVVVWAYVTRRLDSSHEVAGAELLNTSSWCFIVPVRGRHLHNSA